MSHLPACTWTFENCSKFSLTLQTAIFQECDRTIHPPNVSDLVIWSSSRWWSHTQLLRRLLRLLPPCLEFAALQLLFHVFTDAFFCFFYAGRPEQIPLQMWRPELSPGQVSTAANIHALVLLCFLSVTGLLANFSGTS